MEKTVIVASNYWHRPGITVTLIHGAEAPAGAIKVEIGLADFLAALSAELVHPVTVFTRQQMLAQLNKASASALEKIKQASATAVS